MCVLWEEYFFSLLAWPLSHKPAWPDHIIALNFTQQTVRYAPLASQILNGPWHFLWLRAHTRAHTHTCTLVCEYVKQCVSVPLCTFMGSLSPTSWAALAFGLVGSTPALFRKHLFLLGSDWAGRYGWLPEFLSIFLRSHATHAPSLTIFVGHLCTCRQSAMVQLGCVEVWLAKQKGLLLRIRSSMTMLVGYFVLLVLIFSPLFVYPSFLCCVD